VAIALPIHILAIIVWLGGLVVLTVAFEPSIRGFDSKLVLPVWSRTVSRLLIWGAVSLVAIIATGIALVNLRFGGFSGMPVAHRFNMVIGLPAIALYWYLTFVPWQRVRRAVSRGNWAEVEANRRVVRRIMRVIVVLGLIASVVSGAAR
jgi:uncharacterized membrane protein